MNYLLGFADLLLFQSSSCCNISPLWHLQSYIFPDLSLSLCMIASSDRSSSPSLLLYLCLHTVLPSPPLSISCFPIYFITSPCYQSPALLPSFICHPFTSTIILSPPVPSFASRSFSLAESCSVWLCSFLAAWQIDSHSADFDGEEMLLFSG